MSVEVAHRRRRRAELADQERQEPGIVAGGPGRRIAADRTCHLVERPHPRPETGGPGTMPARAPPCSHAAGRRILARTVEGGPDQRGLADARLAADQYRRGTPVERRGDHLAETLEGARAPDDTTSAAVAHGVPFCHLVENPQIGSGVTVVDVAPSG